MDNQGRRGIISGILGTSHLSQQKSYNPHPSREVEHSSDNTGSSQSDMEVIQSAVENSNAEERHKLHRLGSYIDWGAEKFDFSDASKNVDLGQNQTMTHYNPGAGKMKSFTSDDNFEIPLTAYKNIDPIAIPRKRSNSSAKRRKSLLDTSEDARIDGAAQAFLSGTPSSKCPPISITSNKPSGDRGGDHSVLEGLMGSWFFRNKTIEEDDTPVISKTPQMQMEGIGGGALTSRIMNELNMNQNSRPEVEKMNTWAPASF